MSTRVWGTGRKVNCKTNYILFLLEAGKHQQSITAPIKLFKLAKRGSVNKGEHTGEIFNCWSWFHHLICCLFFPPLLQAWLNVTRLLWIVVGATESEGGRNRRAISRKKSTKEQRVGGTEWKDALIYSWSSFKHVYHGLMSQRKDGGV